MRKIQNALKVMRRMNKVKTCLKMTKIENHEKVEKKHDDATENL